MKNAPLVVITGASGLIGTRLANDLRSDHHVVGLDLKEPGEGWAGDAFLSCDLTEDAAVDAALLRLRREHGDSIASVVHLAAYYDFAGEPSPLYETLTVQGSQRLLRGLQRHFSRVEQLVFTSTLLVMMPVEPGSGEVLSEDSALQGEWDYPASKIVTEDVFREERGPIPVVILRLAGAYDEDGHSPPITQQIARIYEKKLESRFFPGNKDAVQHFIHLDDVTACIRRTIEKRAELKPLEILLVAEPRAMSYADLQEEIGTLLHGREWPTLRIPKPVAKAGAWVEGQLASDDEQPFIKPWMIDLADAHYPVSIERLRRTLDWEPTFSLDHVLPEILRRLQADPKRFYRVNKLPLPDSLDDGR